MTNEPITSHSDTNSDGDDEVYRQGEVLPFGRCDECGKPEYCADHNPTAHTDQHHALPATGWSADDAVTAALSDHPGAVRVLGDSPRYLIGKTTSGEGIYLIRDGDGAVVNFTEAVYEVCVAEGVSAGLEPVYHVYSRYNLYSTAGVHWNRACLSGKTFSVIGDAKPIPARVDSAAFTRWLTKCGEKGPDSALPNIDADAAGEDLVRLVREALANEVLVLDQHFEYYFDHRDDDAEGSDYSLWSIAVHNLHVDQWQEIGLTSGWLNVQFPHPDDRAMSEQVWFHLDEVCDRINEVLAVVVPADPTWITDEQIAGWGGAVLTPAELEQLRQQIPSSIQNTVAELAGALVAARDDKSRTRP